MVVTGAGTVSLVDSFGGVIGVVVDGGVTYSVG